MSWDDVLRRMLPPIGGAPPHITGPAGNFGAGEEGRKPPSSIPHKGVDANYVGGQNALNKSHPILHAPVDGEVTLSGGRSGTISIKDSNGFVHKIMHTATRSVRVGDRVTAGDAIGTMGNTGTRDFHLHYQLEDSKGRLVNPVEFWERQNTSSQGRTTPEPEEAPAPVSPTVTSSSQNPVADRFGLWGSVPAANAPAGSDDPANFNDRFGNWATSPSGVLGNIDASGSRAPDRDRRSESPGDVTLGARQLTADDDSAPVRMLSRLNVSPALPSSDEPLLTPAAAPPLLGIFSGKPMRDYPVWPSIFNANDRLSPDDNELYQHWRRWLDA